MISKRNFGILILCIIFINSHAQFFETGQDPASISWKQIITPNFKVIFPSEYEQNAQRMTNILEQVREPVSNSLQIRPRKIPVIIHNRSVESNGLVILAPRRMELFTLPPQDIYSQDWLDQLGLHEYRHVAQMDKLNIGITHVLFFITGEQASGMVAGMIPKWFLEGDAVHTETSYSGTGRGRLPSFEMELRTLTMTRGEIYFYDKMLNGSYKDYIPDYYQYGYKVASYGRYRFGNEFWGQVLDYTGRHPYLLVPFTLGLKKYTGLNKKELQKETFAYFDSIWNGQDRNQYHSALQKINNVEKKSYTQYSFPVYLNDSCIIILKTGIDQIPQLVRITHSGKEKVLFTTGPIDLVKLSGIQDQIVWAELQTDPRWDNQVYSIIKRYDLSLNRKYTLTHKSRCYAPSISGDKKKIVAVTLNTLGESSLIILDSGTGKTLDTIQSPLGSFLIQPCWVDSCTIASIILDKNGKSLQVYNSTNRKWQTLFEAGRKEISDLSCNDKILLFRGSFSGIDNVYTLSLGTGNVFQVSSSRFGAYYPTLSAKKSKLIFSEYTPNGFDLVETKFDSSTWIPLSKVADKFNPVYEKVSTAENRNNWELGKEGQVFITKPYHKVLNLFNFHSWLPFYYDYNSLSVTNPAIHPGITLVSQNLLSTALTTLGYYFVNGNHYLQADFTYKGWYPVLNLNVNYGGYPQYYSNGSKKIPTLTRDFLRTSLEAYVPLNFTLNNHYLYCYPLVKIQHSNDWLYSQIDSIDYRGESELLLDFFAYRYLPTSSRDLAPKFGQILELKYLSAPWNREWFGSSTSASATLLFPGILPHHSIKLTASFEKQKIQRYFFSSQITLPTAFDDLTGAGKISFVSVDYSLPLLYPDFKLGPLLYIKRIRAGIFYDYADISEGYFISNPSEKPTNRIVYSYGGELMADFHLIRLFFPFIGGVRATYLDETLIKKIRLEIVFYANLNRL